jgi:hypothetical protein
MLYDMFPSVLDVFLVILYLWIFYVICQEYTMPDVFIVIFSIQKDANDRKSAQILLVSKNNLQTYRVILRHHLQN